jgi:hypothetical protein
MGRDVEDADPVVAGAGDEGFTTGKNNIARLVLARQRGHRDAAAHGHDTHAVAQFIDHPCLVVGFRVEFAFWVGRYRRAKGRLEDRARSMAEAKGAFVA